MHAASVSTVAVRLEARRPAKHSGTWACSLATFDLEVPASASAVAACLVVTLKVRLNFSTWVVGALHAAMVSYPDQIIALSPPKPYYLLAQCAHDLTLGLCCASDLCMQQAQRLLATVGLCIDCLLALGLYRCCASLHLLTQCTHVLGLLLSAPPH